MVKANQSATQAIRKLYDEQREEIAKANEEVMARLERSRPTPTQEENDLAKLGIHVDEKADDGSGENVIVEKAAVAGGHYGYKTKQAKSSS